MRRPCSSNSAHGSTVLLATLIALAAAAGCQDGPMFALKKVNPWYPMREWAADERLGPTDAQRTEELAAVIAGMSQWSPAEQRRWLGELEKIMEYDESPHMRAMAVQAATQSNLDESLRVIATGLDDDDPKVRMISAKGLANRPDPEATRMLAETISSETNKDVRLAAIKSLGSHKGPEAIEALRLALAETDLSFQHATIASLRQVTGRDAGNEPDAWVAMLETPASELPDAPKRASWRERLDSIF